MSISPNTAWFEKYRPKDIDSMVWGSDKDKNIVQGWINNNRIDGNILLFGAPGTGKTTLAEILIVHFIKAQNDLFRLKSRSVKEIDEELKPFLMKKPIKSPIKIVYIEEFDRISGAAESELKEGLMEKYLEYCVFIGCTNHPKKIERAVQTRFGYKFDFNVIKEYDAITDRICAILQAEGIEPNKAEIDPFIKEHYRLGMRELINLFQVNYNSHNGDIDYTSLKASAQFDENLVKILTEIVQIVLGIPDSKTRRQCFHRPKTTIISEKYVQFSTLVLNNTYDINYDYVFERLYELTEFLPLKHIVGRYSQTLENKKFPQYHLEACLKEMLECCAEQML